LRLFKSQEEKAQIAAAENEYAELVRELRSEDTTHVRAVARSFRDGASSREVLSEKERLRLNDAAFSQYAENVLADDHLTIDEEIAFNEVLAALDIPIDRLADKHLDVMQRLTIARANDGRLEPVADPHLMPKKNEVVYSETSASLMKEAVQREWRGASSGFSFRIAKGVRYRTGQVRGHSVVVGTQLVAEDDGILAITSQRAAYMGSRKTMEFPYSKLMNVEVFTDGIRFHSSNRQRTPLFAVGNGEVVAATLNAAIQRLED
jgi:hypothetical protein